MPGTSSSNLLQKSDVPGHGLFDAGLDVMGRRVTKQSLRLADIRLRMAHVSGAEIAVNRLALIVDAVACQGLFQLQLNSLFRLVRPLTATL